MSTTTTNQHRVLAPLVTLPRGLNAQLRVSLEEYEGHRYVNLRLWEWVDGQWKLNPAKGLTVREAEVGPLADVLLKVEVEIRPTGSTRLRGSPAQIVWAEKIRAGMLRFGEGEGAWSPETLAMIRSVGDATWFIAVRDSGPDEWHAPRPDQLAEPGPVTPPPPTYQ